MRLRRCLKISMRRGARTCSGTRRIYGCAPRRGEAGEKTSRLLCQVLATSDNFTTGIVTALAGIGDDSRFYQISVLVQPGNSGGPLLDENGNLIGIVSTILNFLSEIRAQGDIPQNVNFAIKASVVAELPSGQRHQVRQYRRGDPGDERRPTWPTRRKLRGAFIVCR